MIDLKTNEELILMQMGGVKLKGVIEKLRPLIKPGVTTEEIDNEATKLIIQSGAYPSFKTVKGYRWSTCLPINEQAVHTPPSRRKLKMGDLLTIDIGLLYKGFHTDYADTVIVGEGTDSKKKVFLQTGKKTLDKAISKVKIGCRIGEISKTISDEITGAGYFILKELTGHGIGRKLHEDPYVFGYLNEPIEQTPVIRPGLAIAIEIIYSMGSERMVHERGDAWSIVTADNSLSACFEHTVTVGKKGRLLIT